MKALKKIYAKEIPTATDVADFKTNLSKLEVVATEESDKVYAHFYKASLPIVELNAIGKSATPAQTGAILDAKNVSLITEGLNFKVDVTGYVDTDLGRINVAFSKNVGSGGISARPKEYELGFYSLGNGTTVANRKKSIRGDYEQIAHISDSGSVTLYKKNLPVEVLDQIYKKAERFKS